MTKDQPLKLIAGTANPVLARRMAEALGVAPANVDISRFADGETHVHIEDEVRGAVVCVVQPTCPPVNDHLLELALTVDAARAAGAERIVGVVPYFGYARQEQRSREGECRSAQVVAKLLASVELDHLVTIDLHAPALESALPMPVTELQCDEVLLAQYVESPLDDVIVVAPDAGGLKRAQRYANRLDAPLALAAKQRLGPDKAATLSILGDVRDRSCLIVDDMVSTGRTLSGAAEALVQAGAREVSAAFSHAVMSQDAGQRIADASLERLITSDSVPFSGSSRIAVVSVAGLLADAIRRLYT